MPSIYDLKPRFQAQLRPITAWLAERRVTANQVTLLAAAGTLAVGACMAIWPDQTWPLLLVPGWLFLRMALNAIDGLLAREHGMKSRLGAILNEISDVVSDAALYLPMAWISGVLTPLAVAVVVLGIIAEMTGVVGVQVGASRRYDGPFGKSDRAFAFGALALLLGCGVLPGTWLTVVLGMLALLSVLTIVNRARGALSEQPR